MSRRISFERPAPMATKGDVCTLPELPGKFFRVAVPCKDDEGGVMDEISKKEFAQALRDKDTIRRVEQMCTGPY